MKTQYFPNGFTTWIETHHEVVAEITSRLHTNYTGKVKEVAEDQGKGGLYELAEDLTNEFENLNKDREWDGEFFEEIDEFLVEKLT